MSLDDLPLHPLVVHLIVAFVPLAALGTVAMALRPAWRRPYELPVLGLAILSLAAVPLARESGEQLAEAVHHQSSALEAHMSRADAVLPAMAVYVVLLLAAVVLDRRVRDGSNSGGSVALATRTATITLLLAAVAGIVATALVVWTGHAGAMATWSGTL
jgi:hypothetical protein